MLGLKPTHCPLVVEAKILPNNHQIHLQLMLEFFSLAHAVFHLSQKWCIREPLLGILQTEICPIKNNLAVVKTKSMKYCQLVRGYLWRSGDLGKKKEGTSYAYMHTPNYIFLILYAVKIMTNIYAVKGK